MFKFFKKAKVTPEVGKKVIKTVLAIKDGYVKAQLGLPDDKSIFSPEVYEIDSFTRVYKYEV